MIAMYNDKIKQIKLLVKRISGRVRLIHNTGPKAGRGGALPSFFCCRAMRTGAYVSRRIGIPMIDAVPLMIAIIQKTQWYDSPWEINPPATGPTTGPMSGPSVYIPIAAPLSSGMKRSAIDPAPMESGAEPARPERNRNTMRDAVFGATAHAQVNARKMRLEM